MIWEKLLTDSDGQYSEVQSGRLLNQSIGTSYRTPFKHGALSPYVTNAWSERWFRYEARTVFSMRPMNWHSTSYRETASKR